ncbi:MAG: hypothetical protein PHH82_00460 [Candidatus ainarchaeum sp.]|nr:hypothetical protein [Candidatus ainarchaeum sp.]
MPTRIAERRTQLAERLRTLNTKHSWMQFESIYQRPAERPRKVGGRKFTVYSETERQLSEVIPEYWDKESLRKFVKKHGLGYEHIKLLRIKRYFREAAVEARKELLETLFYNPEKIKEKYDALQEKIAKGASKSSGLVDWSRAEYILNVELTSVFRRMSIWMNSKFGETRAVGPDNELAAKTICNLFSEAYKKFSGQTLFYKDYEARVKGFLSNPFFALQTNALERFLYLGETKGIENLIYWYKKLRAGEKVTFFDLQKDSVLWGLYVPRGPGHSFRWADKIFGLTAGVNVLSHEFIHMMLNNTLSHRRRPLFRNESFVDYLAHLFTIISCPHDVRISKRSSTFTKPQQEFIESCVFGSQGYERWEELPNLFSSSPGLEYDLGVEAARKFCESVGYDKEKIKQRIQKELATIYS